MKANTAGRLSFTVEEAVSATGFTRSRLYEAIGSGELASFKAGKRRMVSARALEDYIAKLEKASMGRAA